MHGKAIAGALSAVLALVAAVPAAGYWVRNCSYGSTWSGQTAMVADINTGPGDAAHALFGFTARDELMAVYRGAVFFQADDGESGPELWRAAAGAAARVAELVPGAEGSSPHAFAVFQDLLYFAATTPETGEELFRFDGATAALAADMDPGSEGAEIFGLTVYDGALYFVRTSRRRGQQQVWRFDGTHAVPVAAINSTPGGIPYPVLGAATFAPFAGKLYHVRETSLPERYELWAYDGASASKLKALTSGDDVTTYAFDLGVYQGALYFGVVAPAPTPENPWRSSDELWRYTGQGAPSQVATFGSAATGSQPSYFQTYDGKLYFTSHSQLYRYDGSVVHGLTGGSAKVPGHVLNLTALPAAGQLFLAGAESDALGVEPYVFAGVGARLLQDIMPDPNDGSQFPGSHPTMAVEADGFYFFAEDEVHGRELWRTSGQRIPLLECDIVVAPLWDDWREWPIDHREVLVVTWLVGPDAEAHLVSWDAVTITRGQEWRGRVLEMDPRRGSVADGFGLATVVFDLQTGALLDRGFGVVGAPALRAWARMEGTAHRLLSRGSLKEVLDEKLPTCAAFNRARRPARGRPRPGRS